MKAVTLVEILRLPFILVADWNVTPEELTAAGWLARLEGVIVKPPVKATCSMGRENLIDSW